MKDTKLRYATLLQLVEKAQDGIVVAEKEDHDTILIYVNPAFEKLTGYSSDEILYQDCRFLQGDDTEKDAVRVLRSAIDSSEPVRTVLKNYRKDGTPFWNELSVTPFHDEVDQLTYYIGIQKDVTDLVRLQDELTEAKARIAELEAQLDSKG
ncbi:MAG: PAS domain-containing protein [Hydrogenovibrio sp.]|uniref:PAS domain-containing protein n=1 Tax=Hydrogenovibrio TaxID=28884 RepID=UPI0003717C01|nr:MULTISPECIES: PAS domain-containing protein [Hydrogenovibrio]MDR9498793.1 PAS domain-containing protein [Hydrogenovibrio sp.]